MSETPDVSDEAVENATGKAWDEWFATLDDLGADEMDHAEIASTLRERGLVESRWWAQSVTVAYEKARGRRVTGETKDAGFQVGVQRTLHLPAEEAWDLLTGDGVAAWLGDDAPGFDFEPGNAVETDRGYRLEVRTMDPPNRLRTRWTPPDRDEPTTLQLYIEDKGEKTAVRFHHEHLADADERESMRERWTAVLGRLAEQCEDRE